MRFLLCYVMKDTGVITSNNYYSAILNCCCNLNILDEDCKSQRADLKASFMPVLESAATCICFYVCLAFSSGDQCAVTRTQCARARPQKFVKQNGGTRGCYVRRQTASFASCGGFKSRPGAKRARQKWTEKCTY